MKERKHDMFCPICRVLTYNPGVTLRSLRNIIYSFVTNNQNFYARGEATLYKKSHNKNKYPYLFIQLVLDGSCLPVDKNHPNVFIPKLNIKIYAIERHR